MTDIALFPLESEASSPGSAPVQPAWLRPAAIVSVVAAHAAAAWLLMSVALSPVESLDTLSVDLAPQGDFVEQQEVTAAEEEPPPEKAEEPDLALPPPAVRSPEAVPLPEKKKVAEPKKKIEEKKPTVDYAKEKREAQARRRMGAPEGRAQGAGMSRAAYGALLAAAIRRHVPATTALGEGNASVSFHVTAGGGISGVSASGSTPAHAALARRIIASVHAPPPPGGDYFASQGFQFH